MALENPTDEFPAQNTNQLLTTAVLLTTMRNPFLKTCDVYCPVVRNIWEYLAWSSRDFAAPSPRYIKWGVLKRNGIKGSTWIETGTYHGDTTAYIENFASRVISIEPDANLARCAKKRFQRQPKIEIREGASEHIFDKILTEVSGDVTFWLDGHWSGEGTYHGTNETPIRQECELIASNLPKMANTRIMIDDMRCFGAKDHAFRNYPSRHFLVSWARDNGLSWHIEHDIFVAERTI